MHVSESLVNSPMLFATTYPREIPPSEKRFWIYRCSMPNLKACFSEVIDSVSAPTDVLSRRLLGAVSGAPMRANGNRPSSDGVIFVGCLAAQKESNQPPNRPTVPGAAFPVLGSSPGSVKVGRARGFNPRLVASMLLSWAISETRNWLKPTRTSLIQPFRKVWDWTTVTLWFCALRSAPLPGY